MSRSSRNHVALAWRNFSSTVALIVLLQLSTPAIFVLVANAENCTLKCHHDGNCTMDGTGADFTDHVGMLPSDITSNTSVNGMHCECPPDYTGLQCRHKFQSCHLPGKKKHFCYHNAECVEEITDEFGNQHYTCDCSTAFIEDEDTKEVLGYAGQYCENVGTLKCSGYDEGNARLFCMNGGSCKTKLHPRHPCDCGADFVGPHCEFPADYEPQCTLDCENGGTCKVGLKTYDEAELEMELPFHDSLHANYQHCKCPDGFTGLRCQVEVNPCENFKCYHGSECKTITVENGVKMPFCDCTTANAKDEETSYAGKFCEHEATGFCKKFEDHNGHQFCTNGGKCADESHVHCKCESGFTGPVCEFKIKEAPDCDLPCQNGGQCFFGPKDYGIHAGFGIDILNKTISENLQHCKCPENFTGLQCEYEVQTCGDGEHLCFHGSMCVKDGDDKHMCWCDPAFEELKKVAGEFCEYQTNNTDDLCTDTPSQTSNAFCVNGGTCVDTVSNSEDHPGCTCPDGFTGDHCELKAQEEVSTQSSNRPSGSSNRNDGATSALIVVLIAIVAGLVIAVVVFVKRSKNRTKADSHFLDASAAANSDATGTEPTNSHVEKDEDGNDMENIEII